MSYIGLDIGTSGCKASIITKNGEVIAAASAAYPLLFPKRGYVELNPLEIYEKVKQVLKELAPKAEGVKALALSSFGEAFVLADENGAPLNRFITYADSRCEGLDEMLIERYTAEKFFAITGVVPNQSFSLCKLLWMKKNCPEILQRTKAIYFADDYYNYLLSGNRGVDSATASKTLLFDIHENDWSNELLKEFGIPMEWFSPVRAVGDCLGKIRKELAEELGLPENMRIYMGCHDQCCATLGGGAYEPGMLVMGQGSTESINLIVDASVFSASEELIRRSMCVEPFLEPGLYMVPCAFLTYGNAIRWYIRTFEEQDTNGRQDIFSYLEESAQKKTDLVFLPHLSKVNIMDPESRVPGAFLGITLDTRRWEFYRAMLQGLNFESRMNLETLSQLGFLIKRISATGGIANSSLFMQLKADVLQKEIHVFKNSEAGILGLAMVCAAACGDYKSHAQVFAGFVREKQVFYPSERYEELFLQYKEYRNRLR